LLHAVPVTRVTALVEVSPIFATARFVGRGTNDRGLWGKPHFFVQERSNRDLHHRPRFATFGVIRDTNSRLETQPTKKKEKKETKKGRGGLRPLNPKPVAFTEG